MAVPIKEYTTTLPETDRLGTALDFDLTEKAANEARGKEILTLSPFNEVRSILYHPMSVDASRGVCVVADPIGTTANSFSDIYTTTDGTSFTKIAAQTDEPFATDFPSGYFTWCEVLGDNSYLLGFGSSTHHKLYKSDNGGTSWTEVLDLPVGETRSFSYSGIDGRWIAIGEYNSKSDGANPEASVFVSDDYGNLGSWKNVYTMPTGGDVNTNNHVHCVAWDPLTSDHTKLYVSTGDGQLNQSFFYLTNNGSEPWDRTTVDITGSGVQQTYATVRGDFIYWASDSPSPAILKHDTTTDTFENVLNFRETLLDNSGFDAVRTGTEDCYYFHIRFSGGLYFLPAMTRRTDTDNAVRHTYIGVSDDMETWTFFREDDFTSSLGYDGYRTCGGVVNGLLFIGVSTDTQVAGDFGKVFTAPTHRRLNSVYTSEAITNKASDGANNDSFEAPGYQASALSGNITAFTESADFALIGDKSLKLTYSDTGNSSGTIFMSTIFSRLGYTPQAGDYITCSVWTRKSWQYESGKFEGTTMTFSGTNVTDGVEYDHIAEPTPEYFHDGWRNHRLYFKINQNFNGVNQDLRWKLKVFGSADETKFVYVDGCEWIVSQDRFYTGKVPFTAGTENDEIALVDMAGAGDQWTLTGTWQPNVRWSEIESGNLPIAEVVSSDGEKTGLYWSAVDQKYNLVDEDDAVTQSTETFALSEKSNMPFAIVCDGATTKAYIHDTTNGLVSISGGAALTRIATQARLGKVGADTGSGLFATVRVFDSALSESDVEDVFNSAGDIAQDAAQAGGYRARYA